MNPDQVIKTAIEKIAAASHDAFVLGAFRMFKHAGATDEAAAGLVKHGNALVKKLLANAAKGRAPKGEGRMSRSLGDMMYGDTSSFAVPQLTRNAGEAVRTTPGLMQATRNTSYSRDIPELNKYVPQLRLNLQRMLKEKPELMDTLNAGFGAAPFAGHITPERRIAELARRLNARK